jgi:hypothetical protein
MALTRWEALLGLQRSLRAPASSVPCQRSFFV